MLRIFFSFFSCTILFSQETYIDQFSASCIYIEGFLPKTKIINGENHELWLKNSKTGAVFQDLEGTQGSAFLIQRNGVKYLVTAKHNLSEGYIYYLTFKNNKKGIRVPLLEVVDSDWTYSEVADVAILRLKNFLPLIHYNHAIDIDQIEKNLIAPSKTDEINSLGFPLGLGIQDEFSPVSLSSKAATGLVNDRRGDTGQIATFFLLDSPSILGISGGPVIAVQNQGQIKLIGLTHAVKSDATGGKLSLVVPAHYIIELLNIIPKYSGNLIIEHSNKQLWTERIYENGKLMEVLYNKSNIGLSQDKGNFKNGNGEIFIYDENNILIQKHIYEDGFYIKSIELKNNEEKK